MVPVRKPGRPLSACPHPQDQSCACARSVTAAIPRKQACRCGGDISAPPAAIHPAHSQVDPNSPVQGNFKIQKSSSRPPSSRKQSFDPANFERMDLKHVNIVPFDPKMQMPVNEYTIPGPPQPYSYTPIHYANIQPQNGYFQMHSPPKMQNMNGTLHEIKTNGFVNGHHSLEHVIESPLATPTEHSNGKPPLPPANSCCAPSTPNTPPTLPNDLPNRGSCCAPKQNGHSHNSSRPSSRSEPPPPRAGSCCAPKRASEIPEQEISMTGTQANMTPLMLPQNAMMNPVLYPQFLPQNTIFTYPPNYGSYQNPLQPSAWRQGVLTMSYSNQPGQPLPLVPMFGPPVMQETLDTVHECGCGDSCQCIGCAAHPYNDATQDYVRSAWSSMSLEQHPSEVYTNGNTNGNTNDRTNGNTNGHLHSNGVPTEHEAPSPNPTTPSSTTSNTADEQSLSASDFFFVNYPFNPDEGCGGDGQSCPCGDDCECLGCTIHRSPDIEIACPGDEDTCPCGDDCACIGCSIHNTNLGL